MDLDVENLPLEIAQDRNTLTDSLKKKLQFDKIKKKYKVDRSITISPEEFTKGNLNKDYVINEVTTLH